jgi:3-hydroxyacyl-[acyl-carrier-protein] dehydratase
MLSEKSERMPVELLVDLSGIDLTRFEFGIDEIRAVNPHRHEFEMLDGIVRFSREPLSAIGVKRVRGDQWWCRGHLPGHPIFPGVLMVEAGAQAASFCFHKEFGKLEGKFFGFGGIEEVRFRGSVHPGDDFVVAVRAEVCRWRRAIFNMQGFVGSRLVCEAKIIGVTVPWSADAEAKSAHP